MAENENINYGESMVSSDADIETDNEDEDEHEIEELMQHVRFYGPPS